VNRDVSRHGMSSRVQYVNPANSASAISTYGASDRLMTNQGLEACESGVTLVVDARGMEECVEIEHGTWRREKATIKQMSDDVLFGLRLGISCQDKTRT